MHTRTWMPILIGTMRRMVMLWAVACAIAGACVGFCGSDGESGTYDDAHDDDDGDAVVDDDDDAGEGERR